MVARRHGGRADRRTTATGLARAAALAHRSAAKYRGCRLAAAAAGHRAVDLRQLAAQPGDRPPAAVSPAALAGLGGAALRPAWRDAGDRRDNGDCTMGNATWPRPLRGRVAQRLATGAPELPRRRGAYDTGA